jgi:hypothetical protein
MTMTISLQAPTEGITYRIVHWTTQAKALEAALEATAAGLTQVTVCQVPAINGRVWGYQFTVTPGSTRYTVLDEAGGWLSLEQANSPAEAVAIYHATGGRNGHTALAA